jgi:hypothetical protein
MKRRQLKAMVALHGEGAGEEGRVLGDVSVIAENLYPGTRQQVRGLAV